MKRTKKIGWRSLSAMLMALLFLAIWIPGQLHSMRDKAQVAKIMKTKKTVCVGRYLINVPDCAEVAFSHESINVFQIETTPENEAEFRKRIAERAAETEARGSKLGENGPSGMVGVRDLGVPGMVGRTYIYGRDRGYLIEGGQRIYMESVSVETHAHIGDLSFTLSADSSDETAAQEAGALLAHLQLRNEDEIPADPGFCIWRAVFSAPLPLHTSERVMMAFLLMDYPDISVGLASLTGRNVEPGLLARVADTASRTGILESLLIAKLRAHKRTINGIAGEEKLERVHALNFTTGFTFNWESSGVPKHVFKPTLTLELQGGNSLRARGKPTQTSLHEGALLILWDGVVSSIRPHMVGAQIGASPVAGSVSDECSMAEKVQNRP